MALIEETSAEEDVAPSETPVPPSSVPATSSNGVEDATHWHIVHKEEFGEAQSRKAQGNTLFASGDYEGAIGVYKDGLSLLPERPPEKTKKADVPVEDDEAGPAAGEEAEDDLDLPLSSEVRDLRAALHANIGACHIKKMQWKEAVASCSEALRDDSSYVKALQRRAQANEKIGTWTSLSAALEDWKLLYSLQNLSKAQNAEAKAALSRLPPMVEQRKDAETAEVMGKLKELGNSFLGKFGLSTDNFKMTPQAGGGYSMNFQS